MQRGREPCLRGSARAALQREPRGLLLLTRGGREAQFSLKSLRNIQQDPLVQPPCMKRGPAMAWLTGPPAQPARGP